MLCLFLQYYYYYSCLSNAVNVSTAAIFELCEAAHLKGLSFMHLITRKCCTYLRHPWCPVKYYRYLNLTELSQRLLDLMYLFACDKRTMKVTEILWNYLITCKKSFYKWVIRKKKRILVEGTFADHWKSSIGGNESARCIQQHDHNLNSCDCTSFLS